MSQTHHTHAKSAGRLRGYNVCLFILFLVCFFTSANLIAFADTTEPVTEHVTELVTEAETEFITEPVTEQGTEEGTEHEVSVTEPATSVIKVPDLSTNDLLLVIVVVLIIILVVSFIKLLI